MFRILWFILGLVIGSWLLRPPQQEETKSSAPVQPSTAQNGREREIRQFSKPTPTVQKAPSPTSKAAESAKTKELPVVEDDLLGIKGIGPTFVARLRELGITSFAQLAAETAESLASKMGGRVTSERIEREEWIEQAKQKIRS
jgi:large subunit ribosomal protein L21